MQTVKSIKNIQLINKLITLFLKIKTISHEIPINREEFQHQSNNS
jgi:hypothetical protein